MQPGIFIDVQGAEVRIRQQRPPILTALKGQAPERALALVPRLLPICGIAQSIAGERALAAARGEVPDPDAWDRAVALADTVTDQELLKLPAGELIHRLYYEEDVRLFEREPVSFRCSCSAERVENMIRNLGAEEARDIIAEEGAINVTCEFCNARYYYDRIDVEALFTETSKSGDSQTLH